MTTALTGQYFNGYLIGEFIAKGGMSDVYIATSPQQAQEVAIKILRADDPSLPPDWTQRFVREVRLMENLHHPNIVPIYDYGYAAPFLYFTMKLIPGPTLTQVLTQERFAPESAWQILKQVAEALAFGHRQGIIHRDIKPDNVLLVGDPFQWHVYLVDFGIGKKPGVDNTLTEEGSIIGTPAYMSPEVVLGQKTDWRADVYSLASLSYEMLLGVPPFKEAHAHLTAMAQVTKPIPLPSTLHPDFPPVLETVLMQALVKDRERRYQAVEHFASDFEMGLASLAEKERYRCFWVL